MARQSDNLVTSDDFNRLMIRLELFQLRTEVDVAIGQLERLCEETFTPTKYAVGKQLDMLHERLRILYERHDKLEY